MSGLMGCCSCFNRTRCDEGLFTLDFLIAYFRLPKAPDLAELHQAHFLLENQHKYVKMNYVKLVFGNRGKHQQHQNLFNLY